MTIADLTAPSPRLARRARIVHENHKAQTNLLLSAYKGGKLNAAQQGSSFARAGLNPGNGSKDDAEKAAMKMRMRDYYLSM